jgi:hypothetical protein
MKRAREEEEGGNGGSAAVKDEPVMNGGEPASAAPGMEDDEDDKPLLANYRMSRTCKKGSECPYLDTISRQVHCLCSIRNAML